MHCGQIPSVIYGERDMMVEPHLKCVLERESATSQVRKSTECRGGKSPAQNTQQTYNKDTKAEVSYKRININVT